MSNHLIWFNRVRFSLFCFGPPRASVFFSTVHFPNYVCHKTKKCFMPRLPEKWMEISVFVSMRTFRPAINGAYIEPEEMWWHTLFWAAAKNENVCRRECEFYLSIQETNTIDELETLTASNRFERFIFKIILHSCSLIWQYSRFMVAPLSIISDVYLFHVLLAKIEEKL